MISALSLLIGAVAGRGSWKADEMREEKAASENSTMVYSEGLAEGLVAALLKEWAQTASFIGLGRIEN